MREKRERKEKLKLPSAFDGMTEHELRGVVISRLIDALRPLRRKFTVGWGYDESGKFWIHLEEKK